ncbi:MAG: NUDIX domain-containing protein [Mariprofundales bacterium]
MPSAISLVALFDTEQRVLLLQRPQDAHCGGYWSLPGGKQEHGEGALTCAQRELAEETGVTGKEWRHCHHWQHHYPDRQLTFTLFQATLTGNAALVCESPWRWIEANRLQAKMFPPANHEILPLSRWIK